MKSSQRYYELGFKLNSNLHKLNPANYFHTLDLIRKRQNKFKIQKENLMKKTFQKPNKDYFVIKSNKMFKIKLSAIFERPIQPKLNEEFLKLSEKIRITKNRIRELNKRSISLENEKLSKRFFNKKPGEFNIKILERVNSQTHDKYLKQIKSPFLIRQKKWLNSPLTLPKIYSSKKGKFNIHSKTEFNMAPEYSSYNNLADYKGHSHKDITHQKRGDMEGQHCVQQVEAAP